MVKKEFKYFIDYKDSKKIRPLCIFLPKITEYSKGFDVTKYIYIYIYIIYIYIYLIKDDELLEKYNEIQKKVKNSLKKVFESDQLYNEKYLKAKIKSYNGKMNTHFHDNKIPK